MITVIQGARHSGKSTLAASLTADKPNVMTLVGSAFKGIFAFAPLAEARGDQTVIVDFFDPTDENIALLQLLTSEDTMTVHVQYSTPRLIMTPNFILCVSTEADGIDKLYRAFPLIKLHNV